MKISDDWKIDDNRYKCPHCEKEYSKRGICTHIWRNHGEGKSHKSFLGKTHKNGIWNKGLTKETDHRMERISENLSITMKQKFKDGSLNGAIKMCQNDPDYHKKISALGGGYRERSGRSHGCYVLDSFGQRVWLQSSYELKCSQILNDLNINWIRPKSLLYSIENKTFRYYPDFLLVNYRIYLDPKNDYKAKNDKEKIQLVCEQNNAIVHILTLDQLNEDYIKSLL